MTFIERPIPEDSNDVAVWHGDATSGTTLSNVGSGGSSWDMTSSGASVNTAAAPFYSSVYPNNSEHYATSNQAFGTWSNGITFSCWLLPENYTTNQRVFMKQNAPTWTGSPLYAIGFFQPNSSTIRLSINAGETTIDGSVPQSIWHHVGFTFNAAGTTLELFVDGVSAGTDTAGGFDTGGDNGPWILGGNTNDDDFSGKIWHPRIANTMRSAEWFEASYVRGLRFFGQG